MAHSISSLKRQRQNKTRKARNKSFKSALKTKLRKCLVAIEGNTPDVNKELSTTCKRVDQIAAKGIIHRNKASRIKSRLALRLNKVKAGSVQPKA
ncbi:MAG: 30S ribosomal protein S20 [Candidatus Brocadiia bacterium]